MSTDGAANMVERFSCVARIIKEYDGDFYKVWCGAHQLDLAVQAVLEGHVKEAFQDPMHRPFSYLRRQTNLISSMGSKCPTFSTTR